MIISPILQLRKQVNRPRGQSGLPRSVDGGLGFELTVPTPGGPAGRGGWENFISQQAPQQCASPVGRERRADRSAGDDRSAGPLARNGGRP